MANITLEILDGLNLIEILHHNSPKRNNLRVS